MATVKEFPFSENKTAKSKTSWGHGDCRPVAEVFGGVFVLTGIFINGGY